MQYRALCLLAIGRTLEARAAVEWLIRHAPAFTIEPDLPPRFVSVFNDTRADVLPDVLQARFAAARGQFDAGSYADARHAFDEIAALASDAASSGGEGLAGIGAQAADYIRQIDAAVAARAEPLAARAAAAPARAGASIVPRPAITEPVVLRQALPPWPAGAVPRAARSATVRIVIGSDGHVRRASIERRVHPQFDLALLAAARAWTYVPAMMNGQPIDIEKVVEVKLP
jgi:TonB family protein